jgi:4-carboxymuconolactone decarboxylase
MARIAPLDPPYSEITQHLFDVVMPPGMDPLVLFRTMARNERIFPRFMRGGVLDKGPVPARDREIVIHRTTALCGAEYEWGVHVASFGRPLKLGDDVLRATLDGDANDPAFDDRQSALVGLCDDLHSTSRISPEAWSRLETHFDHEQILELIYTVGLYHAVSFMVNGLELDPEPFAARFDDFRRTADATL